MTAAYISEFSLYLIICAPFIAAFFLVCYRLIFKKCGALHVICSLIFLLYVLEVLNICGSVTAIDVFVIPAEFRGSINLIPFYGSE